MIVDASVLLSAFFPDEAQAQAQAVLRQHAAGRERLKAPTRRKGIEETSRLCALAPLR
jgi:hypothetical protein